MRGRRVVSLVVLVAFLPACTGWERVDVARPLPLTTGSHTVRVTLKDGRLVRLEKARVVQDSLIGLVAEKGGRTRTGIALAEMRTLQAEEVKTLPTLLLMFGVAGTVAVVAVAQSLEGCCFSLSASSSRIP